jgi:glycosyltransferase involved in cell wall biosynthesis
MRIALIDNSTARWSASVSFTRMLGLSLKAACTGTGDEVGVLGKGDGIPGLPLPLWLIESATAWPGEHTFRRWTGAPPKTAISQSLLRNRVDVALPFLDLANSIPGTATVGWIPDFQATHLPEFFAEKERAHHEGMVRNLGRNTSAMLLSSRDALNHFRQALPDYQKPAEAIPFPSLFAFNPPPPLGYAVGKYHLPEKFALLCNQVWKHKNHGVVIEAMRLATEQGVAINLVCTGLPLDHRDPGNRPMSDLLQSIASAGLHANVHVLGAVPFEDLVDLMRSAAVVVQPSRFEGWSTVVQDALALGRPVICSAIGVHQEQAPGALGFFGVDAPAELAKLLVEHWARLVPGPNPQLEQAALEKERGFAQEHGRRLLDLCRAAAGQGKLR